MSGTKTIGTYHNNETAIIPYGVQYNVQVYEGNGNEFFSSSDSADVMGRTAYCNFVFVDLGLPSGTLWTRKNVGAESETDPGLYFSWGNIEGHAKDSGYNFSDSVYSGTTGKSLSASFTPGDARYDAATANLGSSYAMPTKTQFEELINSCTWTWTTKNGVSGYNVQGTNGSSIFFPAAGYYDGTTLGDSATSGYYWSTDFYSSSNARYLGFNSSSKGVSSNFRYYGLSVRAVRTSS